LITILSGKFKGHKLQVPKSGTRPTSSLVKKALFDMLRPDLPECVFCDLFAGSGACSFEALSQGASKSYIIEANPQAMSCIKANIDKLKVHKDCIPILKKAHKFLAAAPLEDIDIFYIDPPYDIVESDPSSYENLLSFFNQAKLKEQALIILESKDPSRIKKPLVKLEALELLSEKDYGDTHLFFLKKS
jgi:16S rRNA (guanine966-N2)-methyltransferase